MLRYSNYLLIKTLKKFSTTGVLLMFSIFFGSLLLLQSGTNHISYPSFFVMYTHFYYIPFLFGSLYIGIKAINIFKDGLKDGEELLIISRPISRTKIIASKFLVQLSHIIIFGFVVFFTCLIFGQIDLGKSTENQILNFAFSLSIGSFVINLLISGFILFAALFLNKVGTLIFAGVVPFLFIVFSAITTPISKGNALISHDRYYVYNTQMEKKQKSGLYSWFEWL